jgi:uncharacterized membrane protein YcaP (DUF421 family)
MWNHWLSDVFSHPDWLTLLGIIGRTTVIYVVIVGSMRLLGTRALGKMSVYDFVLIVVIANAVQNALVGGDNSLVGGLTSAATLLLLNLLVTWLLDRFPRLERQVVGEPTVLVTDGRPQVDALRREGVTHDELMAALREHGVAGLDDVQLAVLEVDGSISVVPRDVHVHHTRRRFRGEGAG